MEDVSLAERAQGIDFSSRGRHQAHVEGYLALGRVGVDADFCGIKSSVAPAWGVCGSHSRHLCVSLRNLHSGSGVL